MKFNDLVAEFWHAARSLRRAPGYAVPFTAVLALAVGAALAVGRVADATFFRPGAFDDPARVAVLWDSNPRQPLIELSYPDYLDLAAESRSFADTAAHGSTPWSIRLEDATGDPVELPLGAVNGSLFRVLGTPALLGRTLLPDDDAPSAPSVAVIAHEVWQQRFAADPSVVGRTVRLDGNPTAIVGVMPAQFDYPAGAQIWSPLPRVLDVVLSPDAKKIMRRIGFLYITARLHPGVSPARAREEADAVLHRIRQRNGDTSESRLVLTPLMHHVLGPMRQALILTVVAVSMVLLLAFANAAGFTLVRAAARDREIAVRRALGATSGHVVRLLAFESATLGAIAGAAAAAIAWGLLQAFERLAPPALIRTHTFSLDARWIAAAVGTACTAAILAAAWSAARARAFATPLSGSGPRMTADNTGPGRRALIAAEMALALIVVTAAGLAARSFANLAALDLGYDAGRVLMVALPIAEDHENTPDRGRSYVMRLGDALAAVPGVQRVGGVSLRPLTLGPIGDDVAFQLEAQTIEDARENPWLNYLKVTPGYFEAMGIRLVDGRRFTVSDVDAGDRVAIVSEIAARRIWGRRDVVGEKIRVFGQFPDDPLVTVVGVVAPVRHRQLHEPLLDFYSPSSWRVSTWAVRTTLDADAIGPSVRAAIRAVDASQPVELATLGGLVANARRPWRLTAGILAAFALLALMLAAAGVHALIAYAVSRRTQEFGVRAALGAQPSDIGRLIARSVGGIALAGIALGIPGAIATARAMRALLFGVPPIDSMSFAGAALILIAAVALACLVPARRAASVDPVTAMRAE
jgi:predicted permease